MLACFVLMPLLRPDSGETVKFQVDGMERSAIVFRPGKKSEPKPAVYFVFHGLGGSSQEAARQFHIQDLDPSAMVIYGQGMAVGGSRSSNQGRLNLGAMNGWQIGPGQNSDRDVHFVESTIKWADEQGGDSTRRYFIGHSNGSGFAWVVLKEIGDKFSKFVGMNGGTILPLKDAPAKPTFLTTGTSDRIVRPESVRRFAESLAKHNGCKGGFGSPIKTYAGANPVFLYEYEGGHMPPKDAYEKAVKFCQTGRV